MRNVTDCSKLQKGKHETDETFKMKILLCKLGRKLGFEVDMEEPPETELGELAIRHDVLWYIKPPEWIRELFGIMLSRNDLCPEYRTLVEKKQALRRELFAAFEIEGTDVTTKAMKGDISNLSKLPYGIIVVKRGRKETSKEPIRNRFEKALIEFRSLHGPNNVIVVSFEDIEKLAKRWGLK